MEHAIVLFFYLYLQLIKMIRLIKCINNISKYNIIVSKTRNCNNLILYIL